jgi:hypothetical protein
MFSPKKPSPGKITPGECIQIVSENRSDLKDVPGMGREKKGRPWVSSPSRYKKGF